jgi:hypothetical protein
MNGPRAAPEVFAQMRAASDENPLVGLDAMFDERWACCRRPALGVLPIRNRESDKPISNKGITDRAGTG